MYIIDKRHVPLHIQIICSVTLGVTYYAEPAQNLPDLLSPLIPTAPHAHLNTNFDICAASLHFAHFPPSPSSVGSTPAHSAVSLPSSFRSSIHICHHHPMPPPSFQYFTPLLSDLMTYSRVSRRPTGSRPTLLVML